MKVANGSGEPDCFWRKKRSTEIPIITGMAPIMPSLQKIIFGFSPNIALNDPKVLIVSAPQCVATMSRYWSEPYVDISINDSAALTKKVPANPYKAIDILKEELAFFFAKLHRILNSLVHRKSGYQIMALHSSAMDTHVA